MSKKVKWLLAIIITSAAAYIVTSSMGTATVSCEVCMDFKGKEVCRTARGPSPEEAMDTARNNACAQLANGRTENIMCGGTEPKSVTCSE